MTEDTVAVPDAAATTESRASAASARDSSRRVDLQTFALPVLTGALIVLVLEVIHRLELLPTVIAPSPFSVASEMITQATSASLWEEMWVTLQEGLLGFALGSLIGFALGVGIGLSRTLTKALYPYVVLVQAMPRVALAPIFIALLGFGMSSKVMTAVAICFFPVMINTTVGLQAAGENEHALMKSLCATRWQTFKELMLPGALPTIFAGLKTAMTLAFVGAIVGELSAANAGVGQLIEAASFQLRTAAVFGYILWLSLAALALFSLVGFLEKRLVFWKEDELSALIGTDE